MTLQDAITLAKGTWQEFQEDDAQHMSAALSYYALFSLFPLLLLLVAVLGFVLRYVPAVQDAQVAIVGGVAANFSTDLADLIEGVLANVSGQAGTATGIGLVTLLLGASGVFQQLDDSFNKIWNVPKPEKQSLINVARQMVFQKLTAFIMVLAVGVLLIISTVLTGLSTALVNGAGQIVGLPADSWLSGAAGFIATIAVALLLNTVIFALLFKFLPDTKVHWNDVLLGAVVTAVLWEVGKRVLTIYIGSIGARNAAYGAIGSVLVLVAWIYFSSLILYLGAEFTNVYSKHFGSRAATAKNPVPPATTEPPAARALSAEEVLRYNRSVGKATGRGFLVGAVGGVAAGFAALIAGIVFAITGLTRVFRR